MDLQRIADRLALAAWPLSQRGRQHALVVHSVVRTHTKARDESTLRVQRQPRMHFCTN
jgi:hypothetical protein